RRPRRARAGACGFFADAGVSRDRAGADTTRRARRNQRGERIGGGKLRCTSWDDAVVIMPGEALVVNLARPAHALRARCRPLWYETPGRRPIRARRFKAPPEGRGVKAVDL